MCELSFLNRVDDDVAESMIRMNCDLLIYSVSMGRQTNTRPSDLSSIFNHKPFLHIKRMLSKGDKIIPKKISEKKPILHITSHMLLPNHKLLFNSLKGKLIFYEVVRHPLYMIIQQEKNYQMFEGSRNQHVRYSINGKEYTFFTSGWEDTFDMSNSFEKAIYHMNSYYEFLFDLSDDRVQIIPFETFVKEPDSFIEKISSDFNSPITKKVNSEMKRQKVPRKLLSDGPALDIYKRCGWEPPKYFSEEKELEARRYLVASNVSNEAINVLDNLSEKYVNTFLKASY